MLASKLAAITTFVVSKIKQVELAIVIPEPERFPSATVWHRRLSASAAACNIR